MVFVFVFFLSRYILGISYYSLLDCYACLAPKVQRNHITADKAKMYSKLEYVRATCNATAWATLMCRLAAVDVVH